MFNSWEEIKLDISNLNYNLLNQREINLAKRLSRIIDELSNNDTISEYIPNVKFLVCGMTDISWDIGEIVIKIDFFDTCYGLYTYGMNPYILINELSRGYRKHIKTIEEIIKLIE